MSYKKILTVQDISCVGKCSLTVALPIISVFGVETCVIPTAVLSTHTMFKNFTFRDLTCDMRPILKHWQDENNRYNTRPQNIDIKLKQNGYIQDAKINIPIIANKQEKNPNIFFIKLPQISIIITYLTIFKTYHHLLYNKWSSYTMEK